jgi:hypothetical protein
MHTVANKSREGPETSPARVRLPPLPPSALLHGRPLDLTAAANAYRSPPSFVIALEHDDDADYYELWQLASAAVGLGPLTPLPPPLIELYPHG